MTISFRSRKQKRYREPEVVSWTGTEWFWQITKLANSVTIEDNGDYDTVKEKNKIINATIEKVISIVESNGDSIVNDFKIILNDNGEYAYSMTSEVQRLRFLADVFGKATIDKLSNKQKAYSAAD